MTLWLELMGAVWLEVTVWLELMWVVWLEVTVWLELMVCSGTRALVWLGASTLGGVQSLLSGCSMLGSLSAAVTLVVQKKTSICAVL